MALEYLGTKMINNLELNVRKADEPTYKFFEGYYISSMLDIKAGKRKTMNLKQIAEKELDLNNLCVCTTDAFACFGAGIKFVPNCEYLVNINHESQTRNGLLVITGEQYRDLPGKAYQRSELKRIVNKGLAKEEALEHAIWKDFLGDFLNSYVTSAFKGSIECSMGIFLLSPKKIPPNVPVICPIRIGATDNDFPTSMYRSSIFGADLGRVDSNRADKGLCRLVGMK